MSGKPIVLLVASGSAMALNWEQEHLDAILQIWYPGQAGNAIADVLFGDFNPSGKLPVTFYKSVNDLPHFEDYRMQGRTYKYFEGDVLYPFGYGLSYTTFDYSDLQLSSDEIYKNETVEARVTVTNTGAFDGQTVVQWYVSDVESAMPRPLKSLKKFEKIFLKKGASKTVRFTIDPEDLSIRDDEGKVVLESGDFKIMVGNNASQYKDILLKIK